MNRILDRKVAICAFDVARFASKTVDAIHLETAVEANKCIDYAEIADRCAQLLCKVSEYNTLVRTRAELGEE